MSVHIVPDGEHQLHPDCACKPARESAPREDGTIIATYVHQGPLRGDA